MVISQVRQKVYDLFMDKYREPRADEKLSESRLIDSSHIQSLMDDKLKHLKESNDYWVTGKGYHIDERILLVPPEIAWNKRPEYSCIQRNDKECNAKLQKKYGISDQAASHEQSGSLAPDTAISRIIGVAQLHVVDNHFMKPTLFIVQQPDAVDNR